MEMEEVRCVVRGRVQGVFYRDFVAKHARHLALTGYVRNMPDCTVEVVAQGYEDSLKKLLQYIQKGPFLAKVARVDVEWRSPGEMFDSFEIVY